VGDLEWVLRGVAGVVAGTTWIVNIAGSCWPATVTAKMLSAWPTPTSRRLSWNFVSFCPVLGFP
jgi:hypothetical protein